MQHTAKTQRDLWKICSKIRNVVNRIKFNFWEYYLIYDPKNTGFISKSQFENVLSGPLKTTIDLNYEEIQLLVLRFCESQDHVRYGEFCQMVHESGPNEESQSDNRNNETSKYTEKDIPRLIAMKKIANDLKLRSIELEPYFDDYEQVTGNTGLMTTKQFMDMIYTLKINISQLEIQLIIKKCMVYSYMINKNQFLEEINWIQRQNNNPQTWFSHESQENKSTESKSRKYTNKNVFHPVLEHKTNKKDNVITVLRNVQKHVLQNQINIGQFFKPFDPYNKGFVTEDQFRRCLDSIGVSSLHRLYYSEPELALLLLMFKDEEHPENIRWRKFEDEINTVFVRKNLEKTPELEVECPPRDVKEMHRKGGKDWESVQLHSRQLFDRTVTNIRNYLRQRRILLEPYFKVFDKNNHGHIPRSTFRRALSTADIQCSDEELRLLEKRFMNVDGFNYLEFLVMIKDLQEEDIEPESKEKSSTDEDTKNTEQISSNLKKLTLASLISKIQIIVKRGRIKVDQFLRQFDTTNHRIIAADNFLRGIAMSGIRLESAELNLLCDEFSSKENPGYVDYRRFCNIIEEAFTTLGLEQNPSANPKEYLITYEGPSNYLTEEQKISVDSALSKLCSTPNNGLDDLFKDYDKYRQGIVTEEAFLGALTVSKLNMLISLFEIKSLIKGFSKEDYPQAFNYRAFMKAIEYKQKVLAESNSNQ